MLGALLASLDRRWRPRPEVWVIRPVRGVIDLVLEPEDHPEPLIAVEAQSDMRRLEQQLRWSQAKADALATARSRPVSRLLLLRSTRRTKAVLGEYVATTRAAFPASTAQPWRR